MAFCPHCGKKVTEQASKCIACGNDLEPKAKGARFKGTMMMSPGAGAAPAAPAAAPNQAPAPEPELPMAPPQPIAAAPRSPSPASSKVMKATMLGTGGAGLAPPAGLKAGAQAEAFARAAVAAAAANATPAPPPAAGSSAWAEQSTAASEELAATERPPAQSPPASVANEPGAVPDPYADRRGRESTEGVVPVLPTGRLLLIGVGGMLVIAAVGYLAARVMGLIN